MSLATAPLGRNGPQVPRIGFGLMGLSAFYGPLRSDGERLALLDQAFELGERFWDTADMYGDSEDILKQWFDKNPDKRDRVFFATKFAGKFSSDGAFVVDSTPEYAKEACARSLQRLGLPSVDLYYVHRLDGKTPIEKTIQAMAELKNEGKFKYLGISECSAESLRRAHKVHPITAVQIEYSPFALECESEQIDLLRTARELGVAVVAYAPIGRGLLSGALRSTKDFDQSDIRQFLPRFSEGNLSLNLKLVDLLTELANEKGVTPAQLALAWLLAQGDDIFPIPGTTKLERLKENIGSLDVTLTQEEVQKIRETSEAAEIGGARYGEPFMAGCYADTPAL